MTDKAELMIPINFNDEQAVAMFTDSSKFDGLLKNIKEITDAHEPDIKTAKGRDEIRSLAAKVAKMKAPLDELGDKVKADAQKTVNSVNASRKNMKERLDELRDSVRKPLTDYENQEKELDAAVAEDMALLEGLKNIPFGSTSEQIQDMTNQLKEVCKRNDWRNHQIKADMVIESLMVSLSQALAAAIHNEGVEAENERLRAEREIEAKQKAEREAEDRDKEHERKLEENARKDAADAQADKIKQLEQDKADAEAEIEASKEREKQAVIDAENREKQAAIDQAKKEEADRFAVQKRLDDERDSRMDELEQDINDVFDNYHSVNYKGATQALKKSIVEGEIRHVKFT